MASKSGGGCNSSSINNNINMNNKNNTGKEKMEYWRDYFRRANSDIFDIIEHAIMVAASDCPKEFRVRKSRIAELLFTCRLTRCTGCDRVELAVSEGVEQHLDDGDHGVERRKNCMVVDDEDDHGGGGSKGSSKVICTSRVDGGDDDEDVHVGHDDHGDDDEDDDQEIDIEGDDDGGEMGMMVNSMMDSFDAEALTDEIEEQKEIVGEVLRIKQILYNHQDESESVLYESLRRLQLMHLTVDMLKETEIGKAVNSIKRHSSRDVRHLARSLIDGWKIIVDEWVKATQDLGIAAEGGTPDSVNPSTVDEEEGLPSPPMDEGAFFSTQPMDFNQFFDGMDEDGNPRNCGEFNKNREVGRKPSTVKPNAPKRRDESPKEVTPQSKDNRMQQMRKPEPLPKPSRPLNPQSGPGRPLKPNGDLNTFKDAKVQQKVEKPVVQRRPPPQPERLRPSNDDLVQEKLEATKRKLQERYQQHENAKKQRTIQVMEIQDLPKQGHVNKNPQGRFGNNRHWANGRR